MVVLQITLTNVRQHLHLCIMYVCTYCMCVQSPTFLPTYLPTRFAPCSALLMLSLQMPPTGSPSPSVVCRATTRQFGYLRGRRRGSGSGRRPQFERLQPPVWATRVVRTVPDSDMPTYLRAGRLAEECRCGAGAGLAWISFVMLLHMYLQYVCT